MYFSQVYYAVLLERLFAEKEKNLGRVNLSTKLEKFVDACWFLLAAVMERLVFVQLADFF
jgi:hypothetical protein